MSQAELILSAELSFAPAQQIEQQQQQLLRRHVQYVAQHSAFYRRRCQQLGIDLARIGSYDDLTQLPLTTKDDLERHGEHNGDEFLCVDQQQISDICLTSGTTGLPVAFMQSGQDLDRLAFNEQLAFVTAGLSADDRVLIAAAIDRCFMAGMAYFLGLKQIGATAIRGGSSSVAVVAQLVQRFHPSAMVGVPTMLLALASTLREQGIDPQCCGVKKLICIGEPVRQQNLELSALGERLQQTWQAQIFGTYASTEMATTFVDCPEGCGGHVSPQLMMVEVVDDQGLRVPHGTAGEVVATPLQVTGMPLLRFCTGDIATLYTEPCNCGRNSWRLGPVLGRKNQMLKYRGTTVYPPAIFAVLQEIEQVAAFYIEVFDDYALSDRIRVVVGSACPELTAHHIEERLAARIRVKPQVVIEDVDSVCRKTIQQDKRKPVTFFDYRTECTAFGS
ncbi:MAG: AMP-binding protein [Desulfuromonas sp.]|nr:AMP-binding protein [Desulfuromonas sp.]